jgi:hypothetical protein
MDASWFSSSSRCHVPTALTARCILSSSDWASSLRSVLWLMATFERQFGAVQSSSQPGDRGPGAVSTVSTVPTVSPVHPVYWILASQTIMNQSNFATTASVPAGFDLHRINLKYRETLQDIIQFGANLHLAYTSYQPMVVVLHGLDQIVDASHAALSVAPMHGMFGAGGKGGSSGKGGRSSRLSGSVEPLLCRALAVLRDALDHHATRTGSPYVLCATLHGEDARSEPPRYFYFVSRWLEDLYECDRDGSVDRIELVVGDGPGRNCGLAMPREEAA